MKLICPQQKDHPECWRIIVWEGLLEQTMTRRSKKESQEYWGEPPPIRVVQCSECRHLHRDDPVTCEAFPNGIPTGILTGEHDHRESFDGDNGIQFEEV